MSLSVLMGTEAFNTISDHSVEMLLLPFSHVHGSNTLLVCLHHNALRLNVSLALTDMNRLTDRHQLLLLKLIKGLFTLRRFVTVQEGL